VDNATERATVYISRYEFKYLWFGWSNCQRLRILTPLLLLKGDKYVINLFL
jgi:hypothetical protein